MTVTYGLTLFSPDSFHASPQRGTRVQQSWEEMAVYFSTPKLSEQKERFGGISLTTFRGEIRQKRFVEAVALIGLDLDHTVMTPEQGHDFFEGFQHLIYTTFRHEPDAPRWRAILPFDRHVSVPEYDKLWPIVRDQMASSGFPLDDGAKDASRLWYAPCVHPSRKFLSFAGDGKPLAVTPLLEKAARLASRPTNVISIKSSSRYISAALTRAAEEVRSAPEGTRNNALNRAAFSLARLDVPEHEIYGALTHAAKAAGLRDTEVQKTIKSAITARRSP